MSPTINKGVKEPTAAELLAAAQGHARAGNPGFAAATYKRVLAKQPKNTAALRGAAAALLQDGRIPESLDVVERAITAEPAAVELKIFRAQLFERLNRGMDALEAYTAILKKQPSNARALHSRGRLLIALGRAAEAVADLEKARDAAPATADVLSDLGSAYAESGHDAEALDAFTRAVVLKPESTVAQFNRANMLRKLLRLDEAMNGYRRALELDPDLIPALIDLSEMLGERGDFDGALALSDRALALAPENAHARQVRALLMLRHSRLTEGFAALDWRLKPSRHMVPSRPFPHPAWRGEDLAGKSLLIWTEQGVGDEILTAGMFGEVIARAERCVIECTQRLAPLFARAFPAATVVARRDPPAAAAQGPFDVQSAAWSLAQYLRPDFDRFARHGGYLKADADRAAALRAKYRAVHPGKRLVGVSWDSHARHGHAKRIPLELWSEVFAVPDTAFIDLQYRPARDEAPPPAPLAADAEIDPMTDLDAAAAQIAALDLVITISNTTAHLAGALGRPVWTLVPEGAASFWYWFRDRSDSPWYPAMRLFRQREPGAWAPVMAAVAAELRKINVGAADGP